MRSTVRAVFLSGSIAFLVIGLYLFVYAESIATLPAAVRGENAWPWPIGPLLLRFIATFALVGTVGCLLVALRPNSATVAAFGSLAAIFAALLLVHAAINQGDIDWSSPIAVAWLALMVMGLIAAVTLALLGRQRARNRTPMLPMKGEVLGITIFLLVLNALVGSAMFLLPEVGRRYWPWELVNQVNVQLLGAVFLGGALCMLWVWRQPGWYGYDILYAAVGVFSSVALMASFMHWELFGDRPITSYAFVTLYAVGAIMGFYVYVVHKSAERSLPRPDASDRGEPSRATPVDPRPAARR
jgi:hypothetical protein